MTGLAPPARAEAGWLIAAPVVAVAWLVAGRGMPAPPGTAYPPRGGAWLSDLVAWGLGLLPGHVPPEALLAAFSAAVLGVLAAYVVRRLVYNGWPVAEAGIFVGVLALNALVLRVVAAGHDSIPVMAAVAAVVPGLRRLEAVGDAQAEMSFGLVLPLLFLAGPATALLTLPLALLGALLDPLARRDVRAFVAMFLVALMPTLLVVVGLAALIGWDRILSVAPVYRALFVLAPVSWELARQFLIVFAVVVAPMTPVLAAYCVSGDDRRRQPLSAVLVWLLPGYLLLGAVLCSWPLPPEVPAFAFLGAFAAWLAVARLPVALRRVAIALAAMVTIASWAL